MPKKTNENVNEAVCTEAIPKKRTRKKKAVTCVVIESPMGGSISVEEILAKLPENVESVYVRVDQNKLYWVRGEETGDVDIWT